MSKRQAQEVTEALLALSDAREALERDHRDAALAAIADVRTALGSVDHSPGVAVARAADRLGVSEPTVRSWIDRGVLDAVPEVRPVQVEPESLRRVGRALAELRERGRDRDWLRAVLDHLDDQSVRRREAVREGIEDLRDGKLEPA